MTKKHNEDIIDVPFTEVAPEQVSQVENMLNLEDVGYMIVVGRYKNGKTFFRTVGINDLVLVDGLVDLASIKVKKELEKHIDEI